MPIKLEVAIRKGWKAEENDRVGPCVVVLFKDEKTGKQLLEWAPKHNQREWIDMMFQRLLEYDLAVKKLRELNDIELKGGCGQ